jgi:hypothetical protein
MTQQEALALVDKGAGMHFDPVVAQALIRLYERGELNLDAMPSGIRHMAPSPEPE